MEKSIIENFKTPATLKNICYVFMLIGIVSLIMSFVGHIDHQRIWSNLMINGYFFTGISLGALFFIALQYASEAAWGTVLKRVFEAVSAYLPIGSIVLLVVFIAGALHIHHTFEWMDPKMVAEDELIAHKTPYLNIPFFFIRTILYLGVWYYFQRLFRKRSLEEDLKGGTDIHFKNVRSAAIFLCFFAVTSSTSAWDWIMSIDVHWFSTLFGWYVFSGVWISSIIIITLLAIYLKKNGYLANVNESHIHDMGKWMFAISFLWSYLWFSQFMLIWYSNIPEEVTYFVMRITHYKGLFFGMFTINLLFPMLILMSRDSKRNMNILTFVGIIIFIGHWLDVFVMVMPGTVGEHWSIGFPEIGMMIGFTGLFLNIMLSALSKAPLQVEQHPYLDESMHHHI